MREATQNKRPEDCCHRAFVKLGYGDEGGGLCPADAPAVAVFHAPFKAQPHESHTDGRPGKPGAFNEFVHGAVIVPESLIEGLLLCGQARRHDFFGRSRGRTPFTKIKRAEFIEEIFRTAHQTRIAIAQKFEIAGEGVDIDTPRNGVERPPEGLCIVGGDECAAALCCGFHNERPFGEGGNDAVALRKGFPIGIPSESILADNQSACADNADGKRFLVGRIDGIQCRTEHGNGLAGGGVTGKQCAFMSRGIDPVCQTTGNVHPRFGQTLTETLCLLASVERSGPGADNGDLCLLQKGGIACTIETQRRRRNLTQVVGIIIVQPRKDADVAGFGLGFLAFGFVGAEGLEHFCNLTFREVLAVLMDVCRAMLRQSGQCAVDAFQRFYLGCANTGKCIDRDKRGTLPGNIGKRKLSGGENLRRAIGIIYRMGNKCEGGTSSIRVFDLQ